MRFASFETAILICCTIQGCGNGGEMRRGLREEKKRFVEPSVHTSESEIHVELIITISTCVV
jgi:hypothetical protein